MPVRRDGSLRRTDPPRLTPRKADFDILQEMEVGMESSGKHDAPDHRPCQSSASATADFAILRNRLPSPPARASTLKAITADSICRAVAWASRRW